MRRERERKSKFVLKKKKPIESIQASTMAADRLCAVLTLYPYTDDNSEPPSFTEHYIQVSDTYNMHSATHSFEM